MSERDEFIEWITDGKTLASANTRCAMYDAWQAARSEAYVLRKQAEAVEGCRVEAAQSIRAAFDEGFTEGAEYYRSPEAEQESWDESLAKEAFDALKSPPKLEQK